VDRKEWETKGNEGRTKAGGRSHAWDSPNGFVHRGDWSTLCGEHSISSRQVAKRKAAEREGMRKKRFMKKRATPLNREIEDHLPE